MVLQLLRNKKQAKIYFKYTPMHKHAILYYDEIIQP